MITKVISIVINASNNGLDLSLASQSYLLEYQFTVQDATGTKMEESTFEGWLAVHPITMATSSSLHGENFHFLYQQITPRNMHLLWLIAHILWLPVDHTTEHELDIATGKSHHRALATCSG